MNKRSTLTTTLLSCGLLPLAALGASGAVYAAVTPPQIVTIGGTVTGLLGSDLILQNGRLDVLSVESNGTFTFANRAAIGQSYNVIVVTQPVAPAQICTVQNGSGVVKTTVTSIKVICTGGGPPPLSFTGSAPANGATGVSRDVQAALNFTAPLAGASVNTGVVSLRDPAGAFVPEFLGFSGSQLLVAGATKLLPLTQYAIDVNTGLRGTGGQVLDQPVTVGFTTQDGQWQTPLAVGTNNNRTDDSQIVMDPSGNAVAVWMQQFGGTFEIWSNRFNVNTGWGTPQRIGPAGVASNFPRVAVDAAGNALAVWEQGGTGVNSPLNIWANRFTVSGGWGTAAQIETHAGTGSAAFPDIAMEPNGTALAVWTVPVGAVNRTVASRFTSANGWSAPQPIDNGAGNAGGAAIGMDPNGNGTAVWSQSDGTRNNVWSNRFVAGVGFGTPVLIENDNVGSAFVVRIAVDPSGNAFAIWQDSVGVNINLLANRFTAGGTWGTPQVIGTPKGNSDAQIAVDANGDAMVVWEQFTGAPGIFNIASNRFSPNTGWGAPIAVETHAGTRSFLPFVALDRSGNAVAVWQQETADRNHENIFANRFTPAGGWTATPIQLINNVGFTHSGLARVAIDARGDALAIWSQQVGSGTFNLLSDRLQ